MTYTVSESITRGLSASPLIVLGHALLEILLAISLFLGLQTLLTSETVKGTIGLVGGGILLWMGTNILRQLYHNKLDLELKEGSLSIGFWKNPVIGGVLVTLSNPYFLLWWATERRKTEEARELFRKLLSANPPDNPGVRYYILAIRLGMSYKEFERRFDEGGYYASRIIKWFEKNYKKLPDEFGWWEKAVEEYL